MGLCGGWNRDEALNGPPSERGTECRTTGSCVDKSLENLVCPEPDSQDEKVGRLTPPRTGAEPTEGASPGMLGPSCAPLNVLSCSG